MCIPSPCKARSVEMGNEGPVPKAALRWGGDWVGCHSAGTVSLSQHLCYSKFQERAKCACCALQAHGTLDQQGWKCCKALSPVTLSPYCGHPLAAQETGHGSEHSAALELMSPTLLSSLLHVLEGASSHLLQCPLQALVLLLQFWSPAHWRSVSIGSCTRGVSPKQSPPCCSGHGVAPLDPAVDIRWDGTQSLPSRRR